MARIALFIGTLDKANRPMATIGKDPNGRKRILFMDADGSRKTIRLGKASLAHANEVKVKVEHLLAAKLSQSALDAATARWVADLPDVLADKLATVAVNGQEIDRFTVSVMTPDDDYTKAPVIYDAKLLAKAMPLGGQLRPNGKRAAVVYADTSTRASDHRIGLVMPMNK